jgi:hypothetical protein
MPSHRRFLSKLQYDLVASLTDTSVMEWIVRDPILSLLGPIYQHLAYLIGLSHSRGGRERGTLIDETTSTGRKERRKKTIL